MATWFIMKCPRRYAPTRWPFCSGMGGLFDRNTQILKITPGVTAGKLTIRLQPSATGTDATVTYSHTSLGPEGDEFITGFSEEFYTEFMRDWESKLNHYLATGETLSPGA